jgi:DNA-directed RNA polymerase specialized sigma24 family protein
MPASTSRILFQLIGSLRPERWEVIVAHGLEGLPMRQVASIHHTRLNTAYDRLRLGRKDLRIAWLPDIL